MYQEPAFWYEGTTSVSILLICLLPRYVVDRPFDGNQNNSCLLNDDGLHSLWKWLHPASHPGAVWFHSPSLCSRRANYQPLRRESSFRHFGFSPSTILLVFIPSWKSCQNWWNRFRPLNRRVVTKVGLQRFFSTTSFWEPARCFSSSRSRPRPIVMAILNFLWLKTHMYFLQKILTTFDFDR